MKPIAQLLSRDGAQPVRAMPARAVSARLVTGLAVLTASLILTACGGGGGGGGGGSSAPSSGSGSTPPATTNPGGGTTTPPSSGGGTTTTPPSSGGGGTTTTPPSSGGGDTTTPPSSGGGTTTPPTGSTPSNPVATVNLKADATAVAGQPVTLTWISSDTGASSCTISGDYSATVATSGTQQVTTKSSTSAYTASYTITCGAVSSTASVNVTPPVFSNVVQMTTDTGPAGSNAINVPYVSVTICKPGTTQCQTIDHIMVDTGSFGLRLVAPVSASLGLAPLTTSSGAAVGECGQFVSGFTWGSVLKADVKIGSEVAANQSIQVVDGAVGSVPQACSDKGSTLGTVDALGANGVLGIGLYKQDCGDACAKGAVDAAYYACTGGNCTPTAVSLDQQVSNPVAAFPVDNNGVVISYPNVATGGGTPPVGTLIFGIGTQGNNGLNGTTQYPVNSSGNFTTVYKGQTLPDSFLDTGSNGLFFNDSSLTKCTVSNDFYCPSSPLSLSATITAADNSATGTVNFMLEGVDNLPPGTPFGWIGGPGSGSKANTSFDWGLPFFFGRKVYIGMEGSNTKPYWAF